MYQIIAKYRGQSEVVDRAETLKEAEYLANEYRIAYGQGWSISIKKF